MKEIPQFHDYLSWNSHPRSTVTNLWAAMVQAKHFIPSRTWNQAVRPLLNTLCQEFGISYVAPQAQRVNRFCRAAVDFIQV